MTDGDKSLGLKDRAPTVPESIPVRVSGFDSAERAHDFAELIVDYVRIVSRMIDLERLDGITVASDYDDALAHLDRGFEASRPLRRTADDQMIGVAMAAPVLRSGTVKAHMVFHTPVVLPLADKDSEGFSDALYALAHECAHVADLKDRDLAFPGVLLRTRIENMEDALMDWVSSAIWDEYAACRRSALFGEKQHATYLRAFMSVVPTARERANNAIRSYRIHADLDQVMHEAGGALLRPFTVGAYLLGHLHGLGVGLDAFTDVHHVLNSSPYRSLFDRLCGILPALWDRRGHWASREEFAPLGAIAKDVLDQAGIHLHRLDDGGTYIDIPRTPETMP